MNNIEEDFRHSLNQAEKLLEQILSIKEEKRVDNINTISVIADRGFGKTTFLHTLKKRLDCNSKLLVSDIIDPTNLIKNSDNAYMITELVLYVLYSKLKETENSNSNDTLKKISTIVEERNNNQKELDSKYSSGISILNKLESAFKFKDNIDSILKETGKKLVLIFDDFDLIGNEMISKILDELHEYINVENIIFIFAYKESQLQNAMIHTVRKQNVELISNNKLTDNEINIQVISKIDKLLPSYFKIYLPQIDQFYRTFYLNTNKTKKAYYLDELESMLETRIRPARPIENINSILPRSPREYNQQISLIQNINKSSSNLGEKLDEFKKSILSIVTLSNVDNKLKELFTMYSIVDFNEKNWVVISHIREYVKNKKYNHLNNSCNFRNSRDSINSSIADVIQTINDLIEYDSSEEMLNYIYMLKLLISITLKKQAWLIQTSTDNKEKSQSLYKDYINHINGYFMPMTKTYYGNEVNFNNINIKKFNDNKVCKAELEIAFLTLISLRNTGYRFMQNSSFMHYVTNLSKPIPYNKDTEKGNLTNNDSKSRVYNLIELYKQPEAYLFFSIKKESANNYLDLLRMVMKLEDISYNLSNMVMRFEPLNIFLRYDVMIEHLSKGFDDLIIDNVFEIEEIQMYNFYRQGEYYSVANIIKRLVNKYYPNEYNKHEMILGKYISLPDNKDSNLGNRLIELNTKGEGDLEQLKQICSEFQKNWKKNDLKLANLESDEIKDLIINLSKFNRKLLTNANLNDEVVGVIKKTYEAYNGGSSKKIISTKIIELAKAINEGN